MSDHTDNEHRPRWSRHIATRDLRLLGLLGLVGTGVLIVALAIGRHLNAKPGTLADWIAAISTFTALLAASYAAVQTSRAFALEQGRDRQRDLDVRQRQAVQVAVWGGQMKHRGPLVTHTFAPGKKDAMTRGSGPVYPESLVVTIKNASALPVFNLFVELYLVHPGDRSLVLATTYRHETAVVGEIANVEVMSPESVESVVALLAEVPGTNDGPSDFRIGWGFEDVAGERWRRLPDGRLQSTYRMEREIWFGLPAAKRKPQQPPV